MTRSGRRKRLEGTEEVAQFATRERCWTLLQSRDGQFLMRYREYDDWDNRGIEEVDFLSVEVADHWIATLPAGEDAWVNYDAPRFGEGAETTVLVRMPWAKKRATEAASREARIPMSEWLQRAHDAELRSHTAKQFARERYGDLRDRLNWQFDILCRTLDPNFDDLSWKDRKQVEQAVDEAIKTGHDPLIKGTPRNAFEVELAKYTAMRTEHVEIWRDYPEFEDEQDDDVGDDTRDEIENGDGDSDEIPGYGRDEDATDPDEPPDSDEPSPAP